jgi:hypothetical protein
MFGPARTNAIQVRKFQNNCRCSLNIENETRAISGVAHPVVTSDELHGERRSYGLQVTDFEHRGPRLANPDMERTQVKKSGCLRRRQWEKCFLGGFGEGGGGRGREGGEGREGGGGARGEGGT